MSFFLSAVRSLGSVPSLVASLGVALCFAPHLSAQAPAPVEVHEGHGYGADVVYFSPEAAANKQAGEGVTVGWRERRDNVSILQVEGDFNAATADGVQNDAARVAVAQEFYRHNPDDYDFLVVFTTFPYDLTFADGTPAAAFHTRVKNDTSGIGEPLFDHSAAFGSAGELEGYLDMAPLENWVLDPFDPDFSRVLGTLSHEVLHRWSSRLRFRDTDGSISDALLGQQQAHWSFLLNTGRGNIMYGNDWLPNGDGTFTSGLVRRGLNPLDLYAAGVIEASEVPPMELLVAPGEDHERLPRSGVQVTATRREITVDDIVAAVGERVPAAGSDRRVLRGAYLLLVRPGQEVTDQQVASVADIRAAFERHWSVITGGRSVFRGFPPEITQQQPGSPDETTGGPLRPQAAVADALAWLRGAQTPAGYWQDLESTRPRDSAHAFSALQQLDTFFVGHASARTWLETLDPSGLSTDALAWVVRARVAAQLGSQAAVAELSQRQNADGGWGLLPGYESDPLDTALVLEALLAADGSATAIANGRTFLNGAQNADGSWGNVLGGAGRIHVTARAHGVLLDPSVPALEFLRSRQNADGGFGDSPSTAHETALALEALAGSAVLPGSDLARANDWLSRHQSSEGSWEGSVYTTALVVAVLQQQAFPNLAFAGAPTATPESPSDGQGAELAVAITNTGSQTAGASVLEVFDGDPSLGLSLGSVAVPELEPRASFVASLSWDTSGQAGAHQLTFVLDRAGQVAELSETDNTARLDVVVQDAPPGINLELRESEVTVEPERPGELPAAVTINLIVRNSGQADASTVSVALLQFPEAGDEGAEPTLLDEFVVADLPARSSTGVTLGFEIEEAGTYRLALVLDREGAITESIEDDNRVDLVVSTDQSVDLEVLPGDLTLVGSPLLGQTIEFQADLRNRGTVDANNVELKVLLEEQGTFTELQTLEVQLPAGSQITRSVPLTVDREGPLAVVFQLDPGDLIPEANTDNNNARLEFVAGAIGDANFTVDPRGLVVAPNPIVEGQAATLELEVRNNGGVAGSVVVAFFDGAPANGGAELGRVTLSNLAAGSAQVAQFVIPDFVGPSDRVLFGVVDPDNAVSEALEDDNQAFLEVQVTSLPDLVLSDGALQLLPRFPAVGAPVELRVTLTNAGEQAAAATQVSVFDGDPAAGRLVAQHNAPTVAAGGFQDVVLSWTFSALLTDELRVVADSAGALREGREDNNQARLAVAASDAEAFASPRWFSPNGDGVRETTSFFYRLDQPSLVSIEIRDEFDQLVRLVPAHSGSASGSYEWDGREDSGVLAPDGTYAVAARDASGTVLRRAEVTLDTNRSSLLDAAGTPFENQRLLTCDVGSLGSWSVSEDERWLYFTGRVASQSGLYRVDTDGGRPRLISPLADSCCGRTFAVDPAVERVVFETNSGELALASAAGGSATLVPGSDRAEILGFPPNSALPIVVADDERTVARLSPAGLETLFTLPADFQSPGDRSRFSSDGRFLAIATQDRPWSNTHDLLFVVDLVNGQATEVAEGGDGDVPNQDTHAIDGSVKWDWLSNRSVLALASPADMRLRLISPSGAEVLSVDLPPAPAPSAQILGRFPAIAVHPLHGIGEVRGAPSGQSVLVGVDYYYGQGFAFSFECPVLSWRHWFVASTSSPDMELVSRERFRCHGGDGALREESEPAQKLITVPHGPGPSDGAQWVPGNRHLFLEAGFSAEFDAGASVHYGLRLERLVDQDLGEAEQVNGPRLPTGYRFVLDPWISPSGRRLYFTSFNTGREEEETCAGSQFGERVWFMRTLENLTAELRARETAEGGVLFEGTVADGAFERYFFEYATPDAPDTWIAALPPVAESVVNDRLGIWIPPRPGSYLVRLTVEDRAGNRRQIVRQVGTAISPSLADLEVSPRLISPNGDGVLDRLEIAYRVLRPVHLTFEFLDRQGNRVRSIERDHGVANSEHSVFWDGRDDLGLPVPDGDYSVRVQGFEFFFELDTEAPSLSLSFQVSRTAPFRGSVKASARDLHLSQGVVGTVDRGAGEFPAPWLPFGELTQDHPPQDGEQEFTNNLEASVLFERLESENFRGSVTDAAGNQTVSVTGVIEERIGPAFGGQDGLDPATGQAYILGDLPDAQPQGIHGSNCAPPLVPFEPCTVEPPPGNLRITVQELIRQPISQLFVQFRPYDETLPADPAWNELEITEFWPVGDLGPAASGIPNRQFDIVWGLQGVDRSEQTVVRLRSRDTAGREFVSGAFVLARKTPLSFQGVITRPSASLQDFMDRSGLALEDGLMWGTEGASGTVRSAVLRVQSDDDSRYALEQVIEASAIEDGRFLFVAPTTTCALYQVQLTIETEERLNPDTGEIEPAQMVSVSDTVRRPCIELIVEYPPVEIGQCGADPGPWLNTWPLEVQVASLDGRPLKALELIAELPGGDVLLLNRNQPDDGEYRFDLDTSGLAEGRYRLVARAVNVDDRVEETVWAGRPGRGRVPLELIVDRTLPDVELTFPLEGQRVCGTLRPEGRIEDSVGFTFDVADSPRPATRTAKLVPELQLAQGPLVLEAGIAGTGEVTAYVDVWNAAGGRVCEQRTVTLDSEVEGATLALDGVTVTVVTASGSGMAEALSPNGDGVAEDLRVELASAEPTFVDVSVREGCRELSAGADPFLRRVLATNLSVQTPRTVIWDGRDDQGNIVPDGFYQVVARYTDGCGNLSVRSTCELFVDTAPPAIAVNYPQAGDPLPVLVDVRGDLMDVRPTEPMRRPQTQGLLEVDFGLGANPSEWIPIERREPFREDEDVRLALWNVGGLAGAYTLKSQRV